MGAPKHRESHRSTARLGKLSSRDERCLRADEAESWVSRKALQRRRKKGWSQQEWDHWYEFGWERPEERAPPRPEPPKKFQGQFLIGIEEEPQFRVAGRLLGRAGSNMKAIADSTGARLRLRGKGSKFLEGPEQRESRDPLMLCVSAATRGSYEECVRQVTDLLHDVYRQYRSFYPNVGDASHGPLKVRLHEGPREGSY